ncbi:MAG: hypothetical protein R2864_03860 [Syntrophotaleaceae bacterium]
MDMPGALAHADLAIAAFGVTAYELAALGIPAVLLGLTEDHARSAEALNQAGMACSLGHYPLRSLPSAWPLFSVNSADGAARREMRTACALLDGGAGRIAACVQAALEKAAGGQD